ncbi:MAG: RNA methyltransferase [Ignavibacteriales bacterium]|nr:RNA methyltransferase [Ignavibacteriales bacterium]
MPGDDRISRLDSVLRYRQPDLTVVVENVHDPHNVSAILRSCDAAGVLQVQLLYTHEEFPDIGKKSSASADKWVDRRMFRSADECFATLRNEGFTVLATHLGKDSRSLYDLDLTGKAALVFGNEHRGVTDGIAAMADVNFQIPMFGMIQSLNVSVACAVTLFEAVRQRMVKGDYALAKLDENQMKRLMDEWKRR